MMESLWVGIDPHPTETRILAMAGPSETLLKARLRPHPQHPRAAAILLEALSLWQGATVRAALCADTEPPLFDTGSWIDALLLGQGAPLYEVALVPRRRRRRRDGLGLGDMAELAQLVIAGVAR
jgi:hypothetical protein